MRRSTRSADGLISHQIPESHETSSSAPSTVELDDPSLPKFRFIQTSPHSGVSNVNGEVETVHWVVKDRPFAIRILEVPVVRGGDRSQSTGEELSKEQDISWNEVEVRAEVVYTKTLKSVKMPSASEKSALSVDQSVISASVYNHRRSANMLGQLSYSSAAYSVDHYPTSSSGPTSFHPNSHQPQPQGSLLLKGGAGIELSVRLAVLSSHVRNDFCVHLQLVLRGQLIAEWYSETIKSVSKWDKVRQLQDSTATAPKSHHYSRSNSNQSNRTSRLATRVTPAPISSPTTISAPSIASNTTGTIRTSLRSHQTSQKPVSAAIKPSLADSSPLDDHNVDSSARTSSAASMDCDQQPPTIVQQETPHRISRAKSSPARSSPSSLHDYTMLEDDHYGSISGGSKHGKKKKASGEEVFEMLDRIQRVQQEMALLIQHNPSAVTNKKKRAASWEPSAGATKTSFYPSEEEAAAGARLKLEQPKSQNKKHKRAELPSQSQAHTLPAVPGTYKPGDFAHNVNSFLVLLDQSVLGHVRSALTGLLLTRPNLAAILQRLMITMNSDVDEGQTRAIICDDTSSTSGVHSWSQQQQDQIPMLNQSGYIWSDERYELGQSDGDRAMAEMENVHNSSGDFLAPVSAAPVVTIDSRTQRNIYADSPVMMSPYGLDDDDDSSTTMGSPSYVAWSDTEWSTTAPPSPFQHDCPQNPSLTDSTNVFSEFLENPVGF